MHRRLTILLAWLAVVLGCGDDAADVPDDTGFGPEASGGDAAVDASPDARPERDAGPPSDADSDAGACPPTETRDCVVGACPALTIEGETPEATGVFHGFGDPVVRADPTHAGRLWLGYSFPRVAELASGETALAPSLHLARSDDDGRTWTVVSQLFAAAPAPSPAPRGVAPGYASYEVLNFVAADTSGWYGVRLEYWAPPGSSYRPDPRSFALAVSYASRPTELAAGPAQRLGSTFAHPGVVDVDLNGLDPSLRTCALWNEPALHYEDGVLYLATQCQVYEGDEPADERHVVVVFRADATPDVTSLAWRYLGVLADASLAAELGDAKLMQTEIARGVDGRLLVIMNPSHSDPITGAEIHLGCRVLELVSLDPPELRRACGALVVHQRIEATDQDFGTGSCGYDASSETGVILTRRPDPRSRPGSGFTLHATGLRP
ncbi:MAG: exo-alpha-sialidase [Deltaproteobacteria bacterium]|nr:exo-alpha-sialidase [Deltaproteobacteria bacterium]